jgi:hypothetical protein
MTSPLDGNRTVMLPASDDRTAEDAPIYLAGEDTVGESWFERTIIVQCLELCWGQVNV